MRYELQVDHKQLWSIVDTKTGETTFSGLEAGQACLLVLRLNGKPATEEKAYELGTAA